MYENNNYEDKQHIKTTLENGAFVKCDSIHSTLVEHGYVYPHINSVATLDSVKADNFQDLKKTLTQLHKKLKSKLPKGMKPEIKFLQHLGFKHLVKGSSVRYIPMSMELEDGQMLIGLARQTSAKRADVVDKSEAFEIPKWFLNEQDITKTMFLKGKPKDISELATRLVNHIEATHTRFLKANPEVEAEAKVIRGQIEALKNEIVDIKIDTEPKVEPLRFKGDVSEEKLPEVNKLINDYDFTTFAIDDGKQRKMAEDNNSLRRESLSLLGVEEIYGKGFENKDVTVKIEKVEIKAEPVIFNKIKSLKLIWSEASDKENVEFKSLDGLQKFIMAEYINSKDIPSESYDKHKVELVMATEDDSDELSLAVGGGMGRIDVGQSSGDFNPFTQHVRDYIAKDYKEVKHSKEGEAYKVKLPLADAKADVSRTDGKPDIHTNIIVPILLKNEIDFVSEEDGIYKYAKGSLQIEVNVPIKTIRVGKNGTMVQADFEGLTEKMIEDMIANFKEDKPQITAENIAEFYPAMSDEEKQENLKIIDDALQERYNKITNILDEVPLLKNTDYKRPSKGIITDSEINMSYFGVKDNLEPIDEYIAKIKASPEYLAYVASKDIDKLKTSFDITYVKQDFDRIVKWFEKVTEVAYDGSGNVSIKGKSETRNNEPMFYNKGNAQLASNLAKAVADHFGLEIPKMQNEIKRETNYEDKISNLNTITTSNELETALDTLVEELEADGKIEEYEDQLDKVADRITELMKQEQI